MLVCQEITSSWGGIVNSKFENDLRECCKATADFLRGKNVDYNKPRRKEERSYGGERELVAEVYRLLIGKNISYGDKLFFEAIRPDRGEESGKLIPGLVYRDGNLEKCVMEVKASVNNRANGSEVPWKTDREDIEDDYEKLKKNYDQFDSKFLIVAYLGDPIIKNGNEFPLQDFEKWVHENFPDKVKIKVIVC